MKKTRVGLLMPTHFNIHSSLNNFLKIHEHLVRHRNFEITLLTDKKNTVAKLKHFSIKHISGLDYDTPLTKLLFLLGIPRFLYYDLENALEDFDVIAANNPEFYMYAYQAYTVAKKQRKTLVLRTSQTVEGFFLYKLTKFIVNPLVRKAYAYASYNIFTNPQAEERCLRLKLISPQTKTIITGHATDTTIFKPKNVHKPSRPVLLSVGGLLKLKGHHIIIQALQKIRDSGLDAELWIVGEGPYRQHLESLIEKLNLHNSVKLLGNQPHDKLVTLYNQASVFVLANFQEITPAVNEALCCETPVVVMECGGKEFVIPSDEHGLTTKRFDIDDMAEKISLVLSDKNRARALAKKGRKHILDNFSVKEVAEKFEKAYRNSR